VGVLPPRSVQGNIGIGIHDKCVGKTVASIKETIPIIRKGLANCIAVLGDAHHHALAGVWCLVGVKSAREVKLAELACIGDHGRAIGHTTLALGELVIVINIVILAIMDNHTAISPAPEIVVQKAGIGRGLPSCRQNRKGNN